MCLSTGQAAAQSYARLWKDAQAAMNDNKPKTALQTVERIVAKATAERQEAQLLKGVLVRLQLHQDIAPDSAKKMLRQLEDTAGRPDGMTPEAAALWRSAAGQLCMKQWGDTAAVSRGKGLLRASVADFERLHQAKATNYLPLFVEGKESRYFQNDLLSVLAKPLLQNAAFTQEERRAMAAKLFCFYNTKHLREAALLSALDTVRLAPYRLPMTETLRKMAADYRDVPLNVETYIELVAHANREGNAGNATDSMVVALAREGLALYGKMPRAERLRHWVKEKENTEAAFSLQRQRFLPGKVAPLGEGEGKHGGGVFAPAPTFLAREGLCVDRQGEECQGRDVASGEAQRQSRRQTPDCGQRERTEGHCGARGEDLRQGICRQTGMGVCRGQYAGTLPRNGGLPSETAR